MVLSGLPISLPKNASMIGDNQHHRRGFTLIELLIVAAVFSVIFLVAVTAFINVQSSQRQTLARQRVVADGRYVLETIARSVRLSRVDYAYYATHPSATFPTNLSDRLTELRLVGQDGNALCYRLAGNHVEVSTGVLTAGGCDPDSFVPMNPDDLLVDTLGFYILPRSNPSAGPPISVNDCKPKTLSVTGSDGYDSVDGTCVCTNNDIASCWSDQRCADTPAGGKICLPATMQPQVTISLHSKSVNTAPGERADVTLQTTVVSRVY